MRTEGFDALDDLTVDRIIGILCIPGVNLSSEIAPTGKLRVGDAKSGVGAEQQERRNDRASEHDQQVPQRPGLAEHGHRSDLQDDPDSDAEQANGGW